MKIPIRFFFSGPYFRIDTKLQLVDTSVLNQLELLLSTRYLLTLAPSDFGVNYQYLFHVQRTVVKDICPSPASFVALAKCGTA